MTSAFEAWQEREESDDDKGYFQNLDAAVEESKRLSSENPLEESLGSAASFDLMNEQKKEKAKLETHRAKAMQVPPIDLEAEQAFRKMQQLSKDTERIKRSRLYFGVGTLIGAGFLFYTAYNMFSRLP